MTEINCERCGKLIISTHYNQKFCKECSIIQNRKRAYNRYYYIKNDSSPIKYKKCSLCKKVIIVKHKNQKYCEECKKEVNSRRNKYVETGNPRFYREFFVCEMCDKKVKSTSGSQKYCEKCRAHHKKEYQKVYIKKYQQTEKGKLIFKKLNNKRRAKLNNVKESFTMEEWFDKVDKTNGICPGYECKPHFVGKDKLEVDHIIPISKAKKGQIYTIDDIQPLCRSCNSRKKDN